MQRWIALLMLLAGARSVWRGSSVALATVALRSSQWWRQWQFPLLCQNRQRDVGRPGRASAEALVAIRRPRGLKREVPCLAPWHVPWASVVRSPLPLMQGLRSRLDLGPLLLVPTIFGVHGHTLPPTHRHRWCWCRRCRQAVARPRLRARAVAGCRHGVRLSGNALGARGCRTNISFRRLRGGCR